MRGRIGQVRWSVEQADSVTFYGVAMDGRQVNRARQNQTYQNGARHKCAVCGRTELDDPNLTFRYCSKCSGNKEYCQDHLFTHKHM